MTSHDDSNVVINLHESEDETDFADTGFSDAMRNRKGYSSRKRSHTAAQGAKC